MAVTIDDVRHIATLARLGLDDARAATIVGELNTILQHMESAPSHCRSRPVQSFFAETAHCPRTART